MPWIHTIAPEHADGDLARLYDAIGRTRGGVAQVHQIQSLHPKAMAAHMDLYKQVVLRRGTLSRVQRERIAVRVSSVNRCAYCVAHHSEALRTLGDDPAAIEALADGRYPPEISQAEHALLDWVSRIAAQPHSCTERDTAHLRTLGFTDEALLDASLTAAYFAFVNRLVLSLGAQVEPGFQATCGDGT